MHMCSVVSDSATPWTVAHQAPRSMGLSRREYWSGLPFSSPMHESEKWKWKWSRSVMSDSWRPHGLPSSNSLFSQLPASINHKSDLFFHEFVFEVWEDIQHYDSSLEKAMAPHSSTLAWKIPWAEEPGGLQSIGSLRVGHDWATSLSLFTFMHWRRKWQPTPVFSPGESQGWGSLVGSHLWSHTESDTTEAT